MLYRELIDVKFETATPAPRQDAGRGASRTVAAEGQGVSTRRSSVALAAAVLGNTVAGFLFLTGLMLVPWWLERLITLLP